MADHRAQVEAIAEQIGSRLMPDNAQWVNRFTVESTSSSRTYVVAQRRSDNVWGCACPDWRHHRRCKHVTDILRRLSSVTLNISEVSVQQMLASARTAYLDLGEHAEIAVPTPITRIPDMEV